MSFLEGKRILVTGGTGSLGQALIKRILSDEKGKPAQSAKPTAKLLAL